MISKDPKNARDTKTRILDAAEELFASNGFRGTTIRAITGKAGVNLAAANYHFGSKKTLLEEVIKRRIIPLNEIRRERIEEVRRTAGNNGGAPEVRDVMRAFIEPTLAFKDSSPGTKNFFTFIGRSFTDPDDTVRQVFLTFITPMIELLFRTVSEALPELPDEIIFWRLMFSIGSLFHTINICGNVQSEFMGISTNPDTETLIDHIIPYVTAGMKAE